MTSTTNDSQQSPANAKSGSEGELVAHAVRVALCLSSQARWQERCDAIGVDRARAEAQDALAALIGTKSERPPVTEAAIVRFERLLRAVSSDPPLGRRVPRSVVVAARACARPWGLRSTRRTGDGRWAALMRDMEVPFALGDAACEHPYSPLQRIVQDVAQQVVAAFLVDGAGGLLACAGALVDDPTPDLGGFGDGLADALLRPPHHVELAEFGGADRRAHVHLVEGSAILVVVFRAGAARPTLIDRAVRRVAEVIAPWDVDRSGRAKILPTIAEHELRQLFQRQVR